MVQDAIGDDEIELAVGEWEVHQIAAEDVAVRQIAGVLEGGDGRLGNVRCIDGSPGVLGHEAAVEPGAGPDLQDPRFLVR